MRDLILLAFLLSFLSCGRVYAQTPGVSVDTDRDGLSDDLEQALLRQFAPRFMVDRADCAGVPAEFMPGRDAPKVESENGTIYGQAFPVKGDAQAVEVHFYHLWKQDCGAHPHALDAEHVSVLVKQTGSEPTTPPWAAVYWFAAAHEDTVCDVSQIARASTIQAEEHGATVWVSSGKHASFLHEALGHQGCGNDVFGETKALSADRIVNLGEPGHPMNGSRWIASTNWPLAVKMGRSDFPPATVARLNELYPTEIAWFNAGRHPAQGVIAISSTTADAIGDGSKRAANAVSGGRNATGNALQNSYDSTVHAIGTSAGHMARFLHARRKPE